MNLHLARYATRTFRDLARQAGLSIQAERYFFQWLVLPKLAIRIAEHLRGLPPQPTRVPPHGINTLFYLLSRLEQSTWGALPWPFGTSLMAWGGTSAT